MAMTEEMKEARREYMRQYYQTHKEQHRRNMEAYWRRKAESGDAKTAKKDKRITESSKLYAIFLRESDLENYLDKKPTSRIYEDYILFCKIKGYIPDGQKTMTIRIKEEFNGNVLTKTRKINGRALNCFEVVK